MAIERFQVLGCLISFVAAEPVLGVNVVPFAHGAVAEHFGNDGGGGDGVAAFIALNDGELGDGDIERESVDQDVIGRGLELFDGELHGEAGSMVDVDAVDGFGVDGCNSPGDSTFLNAAGEHFAVGRFYLFGIVKTTDRATGTENNCSGYDGTEQGTAADFIGTGDGHKSARAQIQLKRAIADPSALSEGLLQSEPFRCGPVRNVL